MHRPWVVVVAAMGACVELYSLERVPVVGGTEDQRTLVEAELEYFDTEVRKGRLAIGEIRFEALPVDGSINSYSRVVTLDEDLALVDVRYTLRHELCHGLDFEERLSWNDRTLFDALADTIEVPVSHIPGPMTYEEYRRSEGLAAYCSMGPLAGIALASPCDPSEREEWTDAGEWLRENVWQGMSSGPLAWDPMPVASWPTPVMFDDYWMAGTDDPPGIAIELFEYREPSDEFVAQDDVVVDLYDGSVLDVAYLEASRVDDDFLELDEPYGELWCFNAGSPRGWAEGPRGAACSVVVPGQGSSVERLFVDEGPGWRVAEPACAPEEFDIFPADGRVWIGWAADAGLVWATLR